MLSEQVEVVQPLVLLVVPLQHLSAVWQSSFTDRKAMIPYGIILKLSVLPQVARMHMRPVRAQTYFAYRNLDRLIEDPNAHLGQLSLYIAGEFRGHILSSVESMASHHRFPLFSNHVAIELCQIA